MNTTESTATARQTAVMKNGLFSEAASWECDLDSGKVIHAVGVHRVLGSPSNGRWSRQALIDAFVPSDRQTVTEAFVVAETTGSIDIEGRIATPDGACRWIRLEGRIRPDTPFALAGFLRDVTAAHESRARLLHAAEMEAVGEIAAGIAHDLKNFLHVIGNNLELLGRRSAGDEKIARLSGSAQRALLRAARLSQQLLTTMPTACKETPVAVASRREPHRSPLRASLPSEVPDVGALHQGGGHAIRDDSPTSQEK